MNALAKVDHPSLCSIDLEQEVLGAALITNSALDVIEREISAADFFEPLNSEIFEAFPSASAMKPAP